MKPAHSNLHEDLICTDNGHKPQNMHKWGPGVRDIHALHYVIRGKGCFESNNVTYTLLEGESFILFPGTEVYYYPDPKDPWEYIWIDFKGDEALRLLSMTNFTHHNPVAPVLPENLEPLFHIIEAANKKPFEKERSNARLRLLLSYYMEYYPREDTVSKTDYVLSAKEYIENNYWKAALTVSDIVDFVKIERTYLFRLFKEATGMSLLNYLTSYRIRRACILLRSSELSIKSVSCSVGYPDQLYFSKVFKKATSYSPSDYKKQYFTK
ncbi:MAG: AraC family transcriptional regulator [Bacillota bacterium]|nr:AraC family transcriptional regulator [Bacillota bacterium]